MNKLSNMQLSRVLGGITPNVRFPPVADIKCPCDIRSMRLADELKDSIMVALGTLVAAVLVVPLAVAQLVLLPFASTDTPEDVAALIRKCIDRAEDADDELDAFTSRKIRDPRLDRIKTELTALAGADWEAPETRARLRKLLRRVEAMG